METQEQKTETITKDTLISEIIEKFPKAAEILMEYGLMCVGCPLAGEHSLKALKDIYGFGDKDIEDILTRINKLIK